VPANRPNRQLLFLDACCLINLVATDQIEKILGALPHDCATSRLVVSTEVISVGQSAATSAAMERETLAPSYLESLEALRILDLSSKGDLARFIQFAAELDDGEASVCALAVTHGGAVATDDRKTLRLLERKHPQVAVVQTPELLYAWAELAGLRDQEMGKVLRSVYQRGRFYPRRDVPRFDWWERLCPK
jgi:predicted nucleic acid-binding protein